MTDQRCLTYAITRRSVLTVRLSSSSSVLYGVVIKYENQLQKFDSTVQPEVLLTSINIILFLKAGSDMYHLPDPITVSVSSTRIMIAYVDG
jgi:hypothetical protein